MTHYGTDEYLSITLIILYVSLALVCTFQIGRIVYFRHMLKSFQFGFLMICLAWCGLRSLFFCDGGNLVEKGWQLLFVFWLPVDLQFATFSLLVMFYAFLLYQAEWEDRRKVAIGTYIVLNVGVLVTTLTYIGVSCSDTHCEMTTKIDRAHHIYMAVQFFILVTVYATIAYKLWSQDKMSGSTLLTLTAFVIFFSRFVYNIFVSVDPDEFAIELEFQEGVGLVAVKHWVFVVLVIWEIVPSGVVLFFFRTIPATDRGCCYRHCRSLRIAELNGGSSLSACDRLQLSIARCCRGKGTEIDTGVGSDGYGVDALESRDDGLIVDDTLGSITSYAQPAFRSPYGYSHNPDMSYYLYPSQLVDPATNVPGLGGVAGGAGGLMGNGAGVGSLGAGGVGGMGHHHHHHHHLHQGGGDGAGVLPGSLHGSGRVVNVRSSLMDSPMLTPAHPQSLHQYHQYGYDGGY